MRESLPSLMRAWAPLTKETAQMGFFCAAARNWARERSDYGRDVGPADSVAGLTAAASSQFEFQKDCQHGTRGCAGLADQFVDFDRRDAQSFFDPQADTVGLRF